MGCPGGTRLVFTRAFRAKKNFSVYFSGKRRSLLHPNTTQRYFFSHYNLGKLKEQLARKARVDTEPGYRIVLMPPGYPIILLKSNNFNMVAVSVNWSIIVE